MWITQFYKRRRTFSKQILVFNNIVWIFTISNSYNTCLLFVGFKT